jgi:hypothetical protein
MRHVDCTDDNLMQHRYQLGDHLHRASALVKVLMATDAATLQQTVHYDFLSVLDDEIAAAVEINECIMAVRPQRQATALTEKQGGD